MMSAHAVPASAARPLADPAGLVGQWVRLYEDGTVGLLLSADRTGWTLRTPTGDRTGTGRLAAEPITSESEARPVRRRLRAVMDDPAFPGAADLDLLDLQLAAHP
ncbi:hypothetical protein [Nocardiopsis ganjiahuensis]|uniref:hypothetical protein n=1 Tax=Nocardiopsis ganjiahuensis TaxID=239984 RepID=UPI00034584ED|nr:hypothetical protein [Nocardiopsis ganjiahuensis]